MDTLVVAARHLHEHVVGDVRNDRGPAAPHDGGDAIGRIGIFVTFPDCADDVDLVGIDVRRGDAFNLAGTRHDVHSTPVGNQWHREFRNRLQCDFIIQRP